MISQTVTYLDVKASELPVNKYYTFSKKTYLFKFKKNDNGIYTVEIWDNKDQNCLFTNKITYGMPIIDSLLAPFQDKIIPLNLDVLNGESGTTEINDETFGNQIKLYTGLVENGV